MEYPSLLWESGLNTTRRLFPVGTDGKIHTPDGPIALSVLEDLLPAGAFTPLSSTYFRFPCTASEILSRQKLIRHLADEEALLTVFTDLGEELSRFERLYHRWQAPELPKNQHALLFPTLASAFLQLAEHFAAGLPDTDAFGYTATVRRCFADLCTDPRIMALSDRLDSFRRSRGEGVKLSLADGTATAFSVTERYENTLQRYFTEMGIADAWPTTRPHRADNTAIDAYCAVYPDVLDKARRLYEDFLPLLTDTYKMEDILLYIHEIRFCREAALYTRRLEEMGYPTCLPTPAAQRCVHLRDLRDISLLSRKMRGEEVVPNDVAMSSENRFFYVTGANGGGKTTFLRSLGIAVLFFLTGCPVAARNGEIWPFARLCTHFPSPENFEETGRFVDELRRADEIRSVADADTMALFNETFSGTDEQKSEEYSRRLAEDIHAAGAFGLYVTHIHSLTHGKIPTLAAVIDENDENRRTYRIRPIHSTDCSFASDILKKYRLTEEGLAERLAEMRRKGERL